MGAYRCATCGEEHEELPRTLAVPAPDYWLGIPEAEREKRGELSADQCVVDGEHFFVRGRLEIPVRDGKEPFAWGVWCSLSKANFTRMSKMWTARGREKEPPYFGWLATRLPDYPDTLLLKTNVHTRAVGLCPLIEVEPTDHPLAIEQREGITSKRLHEIVQRCIGAG